MQGNLLAHLRSILEFGVDCKSCYCRFNKKYMLLCGVWYGKEKPSMLTFLRPVIEQINHLYNEGMYV